jgi:hypothetical protein
MGFLSREKRDNQIFMFTGHSSRYRRDQNNSGEKGIQKAESSETYVATDESGNCGCSGCCLEGESLHPGVTRVEMRQESSWLRRQGAMVHEGTAGCRAYF